MSEIQDRVWMEIEVHPGQDADERARRIEQFNRLLARLGIVHSEVAWHHTSGVLVYRGKTSGIYVELPDKGHWWNLAYLGRPEPAPLGPVEQIVSIGN